MWHILAITGPIYLCIALGFLAVRLGWFAAADLRTLGRFVVQFALPALVFQSLSSRPLGEVFDGGYLLAYALGSSAMLLCAWWWARRAQGLDGRASAVVAMGMGCSNSGYVGYPVLFLTLGPVAGVVLALNMLVENLYKIPLLLTLAEREAHAGTRWSQQLRGTLLQLARTPLIVAIVLGLLVAALRLPMPDVLVRSVGLFATASTALSLFVIGGSLVGLQLRGMRRRVAAIALGKLALHPLWVALAVVALAALGLPAPSGEMATAAVLSAAMPMMGIYPILAQRFGQEAMAAAALLLATVASFFTLSGLLWLLPRLPI